MHVHAECNYQEIIQWPGNIYIRYYNNITADNAGRRLYGTDFNCRLIMCIQYLYAQLPLKRNMHFLYWNKTPRPHKDRWWPQWKPLIHLMVRNATTLQPLNALQLLYQCNHSAESVTPYHHTGQGKVIWYEISIVGTTSGQGRDEMRASCKDSVYTVKLVHSVICSCVICSCV